MRRPGSRGSILARKLPYDRSANWLIVALILSIGVGFVRAAPVVLGVDRFYAPAETNLVEVGLLLRQELMCVNCHQNDDPSAPESSSRSGLDLSNVSSRVRLDYLAAWLEHPHQLKPGTTMPDVLAEDSSVSKSKQAKALSRFLWELNASSVPTPRLEAKGDPTHGNVLYHTIGCVACHAPRDDFQSTSEGQTLSPSAILSAAVPLGDLSNKYTPDGLVQFLMNPTETRPAQRMPHLLLAEQEAADLTAYLLGRATNGGPSAAIASSPDEIQMGRDVFAKSGCAACHDLSVHGQRLVSQLQAPRWKDLPAEPRGCLSARPTPGAAWYDLSPRQRKALLAVLEKGREGGGFGSVSASDRLRRQLVSLNCLACHERDGWGGAAVDPERLKYFTTTGADLEDEGRIPPRLTGAGRKLTREALVRTLQGQGSVRLYMTTRMPAYESALAEALADLFAEVDQDPDEKPTPRQGEENLVGRNLWGRALMGQGGLGCIQCHPLNGTKSLGIQAMDLAHAPRRLRPEWFRDYLIDPPRYRPGTRMPSFWPEGKPLAKGNGGTTDRQIDSIWAYLNELDQSRLPEGLETKGQFELIPRDRPIVFRTFMKEAGLHAIAVGFPEGWHAAFDAKQVRWALAWQGRFLDAESTWDDRFTPLTGPLGINVLQLGDRLMLAVEPGSSSDSNPRFRGYRLTPNRTPVFLYDVEGIAVDDQMQPEAAVAGFRRIVTLKSLPASTSIRIARGTHIMALGESHWRVDDQFDLELVETSPAGLSLELRTGHGDELWIRAPERDVAEATVQLRIAWP